MCAHVSRAGTEKSGTAVHLAAHNRRSSVRDVDVFSDYEIALCLWISLRTLGEAILFLSGVDRIPNVDDR